jgi:hypothetical protein
MRILKNMKVSAVALHCLALATVTQIAAAEQTGSRPSGGPALFSGPQQQTTSRQVYNPLMGPDYPMAPDSYFTDDSGNILMYVKVLGEVNKQGPMIVREDVDFSEIMANSGGLKPNADLHKVLVARQKPDENGKQAYIIDLKKFYKYGDRTAFIALKPNDTIIFPEKGISIDKLAKISSIIYPWASVYSTFERNN